MPPTDMQPLGRRLAEWRSAQQLSLAAAARSLGVHPSTYPRWEQGRRPYPRHLEKIAAVLDVDLATVTASAGPSRNYLGRPAPADASVLTKARLAAGVNRVELGRHLHVSPATVYHWERGGARPPQALLPDLARLLDLTRQELDEALSGHPPARSGGQILPSLGRMLRERGWTRAEVEALLCASPSSVFEWETGRTRTPAWALDQLASALGMESRVLASVSRVSAAPRPAGMSLGDLRRRVRMTQREAAAIFGVSASSLGRYESRRRPIGIPLGRQMARVYRVPLAQVLAIARVEPPRLLLAPNWRSDQLPAVLADLRAAAGSSMSEVARLAGVSHPTVRRWEAGESVPSAGALATLEVRYRLGRGRLTSLGIPRGDRPGERHPPRPASAPPDVAVLVRPTADQEEVEPCRTAALGVTPGRTRRDSVVASC
jgi:transcriptional regulator with XRE-family HTH domain